MTSEELEEIKEEFCDEYCKMPELYLQKFSDPDEASAEMVHEKCRFCPLERMEV